jgi:cyclopropane-fatty-acyl-phospholipid synthase
MSEGMLGSIILALGRKFFPKDVKGSLALTLPSGEVVTVGQSGSGFDADLQMRNYSVIWASIRRGQLGFFERYLAGDLESKNPTTLFRFYLQNRQALDDASTGFFFTSFFDKLWHKKRDNDKDRAKENISAHYDLGNSFYEAWLDDTMSYSSAVFDGTGNSLEAAQRHKVHKVMDAAEVEAGKSYLEIGCGWGGVAEETAKAGASLRGITLSLETPRLGRQGGTGI